MEISPFPFLNLQEDECSHFFSLFQDMDDMSSFHNGHNNNDNDNNDNPKKRQRKEEEAINNTGFGDILASLLLLDEEAKQEQEKWNFDSHRERVQLESHHRQEVRAMNDYYGELQSHYSGLEELDNSRSKRARKSAVVAVSAAAGSSGAIEDEFSGRVGDAGQNPSAGSGQRRLWVRERSTDWWDRVNRPDFPDDEFKREFRMSKATFDLICDELDSVVMKKNTMLRDAIPVKKRVAVCIWRLATGQPLRLVSKRFGLGISTCHKLVLEVCRAIYDVLMPKYLRWPSDAEIQPIKDKFTSRFKIPNVIGSIYTTHIPIIAPKIQVAAYFNKRHTERNQKTSYSITVQGVVNPSGIFTDVTIGNPGSMSDEQVLQKSSLFRRLTSPGAPRDISIVGNSGFPLTDWLLVPYTHQNLTWTQHAFNERIGEIQSIAKEAFGRFKARWSCLQKRTEVKLQDLPYVLGACCVLHNICELRKEEMDPEIRFEVFDDETVPENNLRSVSAIQTRDRIAHDLLHHGLAGTSFL